tara:strand:- start:7750 stop:8040 length:291 start_codon:yes stop_codon:yes gene_type:complete
LGLAACWPQNKVTARFLFEYDVESLFKVAKKCNNVSNPHMRPGSMRGSDIHQSDDVVVAPEELLSHTAAATGLLELLWRALGPTGSNKKCRTVMLP